jgi:mannose-6-phosphate isomerase-like protein (cupin superfamily)
VDALDLLSGDAQAFLDKVWATRVHLHQADPDTLVALLPLDEVDRLLTSSALRTPALRVVHDGAVRPASAYTRSATTAGAPVTGLVDARKALALYDDGATLVLQGLQRYHPPLTRLVRRLELALGHPCQANAYLTPPGSQGFARHRDTHDVFVFQTHGHKRWEIVEDEEEREVLLEPGLSMYLPTGTPHSARSQDVASLHVTIGINRLCWRDALRSHLEGVLADRRYDAPLPAGYLDEPDRLAGPLAVELDRIAASLLSADTHDHASAFADRFLTERPPALEGALCDREASLRDDTVLVHRATAACVLRPGPDRLRVLLGDRELSVPGWLREAMEYVRDHEALTPGDLAGWLDEPGRLVLCGRLVREGLLRVAPR